MRALVRRLLPLRAKEAVAVVLGSGPVVALIRLSTGNVIPHHGTRIFVGHPRISDYMVASIVWKYYERAEVDLIKKWVPATGDVIELGASAGIITALIASRLGPGRRLISTPFSTSKLTSRTATVSP